MWVKKLEVEAVDVKFMGRKEDPLDGMNNPYDNMVEDMDDFEEMALEEIPKYLASTKPEETLPPVSAVTTSQLEDCWNFFLDQ